MSSEYAQSGLQTQNRGRRLLFWAHSRPALPTPHDPSDTPNAPLPAPDEDDTGRFRPGTLSPVDDQPGVRANRLTPLAFLWSRIGAFDRLLLLAEAVCALVVAWLVAQYIYTVYFDSAPRRVTPASSASLAPASRRSPAQAPTTPPVLTLPGMWEDDPQAWGRTPVAGAAIQAPRPTATPTIDPDLLLPTRLRIPVMFLDSPVHEVTVNMGTWEVSPMQIGHHQGTANPGDVGNVVLAGHRDINSALFRELDRLKPGDEIFVSNSFHEYKYVVTESFVVGPTHTEVMDPTNDKRVTLITCTPIGLATQRLIVTAILDER